MLLGFALPEGGVLGLHKMKVARLWNISTLNERSRHRNNVVILENFFIVDFEGYRFPSQYILGSRYIGQEGNRRYSEFLGHWTIIFQILLAVLLLFIFHFYLTGIAVTHFLVRIVRVGALIVTAVILLFYHILIVLEFIWVCILLSELEEALGSFEHFLIHVATPLLTNSLLLVKFAHFPELF